MMYVIIAIICLLAGFFVSWYYLNPSRIEAIQQNESIKKTNEALEIHNAELKQEKELLNIEISSLKLTQETINSTIEKQKKQAQTLAQTFYEDQIAIVNEKFDRASEQLSQKYREDKENYEEEYLQIMEEIAQNFTQEIADKKQELMITLAELENAEKLQAAIVEANKRKELEENQKDFYKLQLSDEDIREIKKLKEVVPFLRNFEPLNKVIWKSYYEKPFTDLIGRVVGNTPTCGIYKITNLNNQMSYIGQSVNIKERWRTHVKRGLGAETPTASKLYVIMNKIGVENFSFEVIETCPREKLNEEERYWISFYKTQEFGYNETKGNA